MKITISVKQKHINTGIRGRLDYCPIALAFAGKLENILGDKKAEDASTTKALHDKGIYYWTAASAGSWGLVAFKAWIAGQKKQVRFNLTQDAKKFINDFDDYKTVKPQDFTVTLKDIVDSED